MLSSEAGRWQAVFSKVPRPQISRPEVYKIARLVQRGGGTSQRQHADRPRAIFAESLGDFVRG